MSEDLFGITVDGDTISITGDLDAHTAPQLDAALDPLLERGADPIVLQMAGVEFVDSSGLRCMIRARHEGDVERSVVIDRPSSATVRLLEITGMLDQFTVRNAQ